MQRVDGGGGGVELVLTKGARQQECERGWVPPPLTEGTLRALRWRLKARAHLELIRFSKVPPGDERAMKIRSDLCQSQ